MIELVYIMWFVFGLSIHLVEGTVMDMEPVGLNQQSQGESHTRVTASAHWEELCKHS